MRFCMNIVKNMGFKLRYNPYLLRQAYFTRMSKVNDIRNKTWSDPYLNQNQKEARIKAIKEYLKWLDGYYNDLILTKTKP